jgi:subtilisin-like proprotein convertase family protein
LLGVICSRMYKGRPGPAPTTTLGMPIRGELRSRTRIPDLRRLILLSVVSALAALLLVAAPASAETQTFTNPTLIKIPASGDVGPASPYPSTVAVSGMSGPVTDVNVTLHRFGHTVPASIAVLLVSPSGDTVKLMQDNCGIEDIEDFTWIFDQQAANPMLRPGGCPDFVYRPNPGSFNSWPAPAPPGPHGVSLSDFNNEQANGTWSLYVVDLGGDHTGDIEGGWSLTLSTGPVDVVIPGTGTSGPASPYPATRTVSGVAGGITDLNVTIDGIWHERPEDLDLLLVGPQGQKVILMSDACGPLAVSNYGWVWDDEAAAPMPQGNGADVCGTRFHRPANHGSGDLWPAPAPAGPYATALSAFDGTNSNGEWKLFVQDDADGGTGFFTNRFQLHITTDSTAPTVTSVAPTDRNVSPKANLSAAFSEAMDAATITKSTFTLVEKSTAKKVAATVSYDAAAKKATLNPTNDLKRDVAYKATVSTGAKDLAGNALDQNPGVSGNQSKSWSFKVK